ncbi:MFS transporter [Pseudonocardia sp. KRD291]|uniref:MFS transporter n=1 Tax=Pseudonocardia sp. KRD291 TaxID=2792007 RepID=UPI001C4A0080|nr:MFS transporter [Pseudonocardia sp. KRD291]MBW0101946.1 MFS transporter [Pseudonocardia sp. KRD291]
MLMATINSSIVLIALPDIFRGIGINPLEPGNTSYLLWMIMGFLVVTAVLVVGFGRLGDMYGRVRMYNLGFAVFTVASVFLWLTWQQGDAAALWLIGWRIVQGVGGAFLMANSSAILTDAFPVRQRGLALGINGVAAIAGSFFGLVIGGLLGPIDWKLVFLVSVPFGLFGTVWAYLKLRDTGERRPAKMDWWGNITFAVGLIAVLVGITYGIQPYGTSVMGWGSPTVLICLIGGVIVLGAFVLIERKVSNPLFTLSLFANRRFTLGNIANLLASLGRGGLQFVLIIWLQGIWLPQHGYSFEETPLWAGIYMLPLTVGFLIAAPVSGVLCDRYGARWLATGGMLVSAVSFLLLEILPINFGYLPFAAILLVNGLGMGLFSSPNRADIMNSLPDDARGAGAGMTATFQNAAMVLSIGFFFSLMIAGLSQNLPSVMEQGLLAHAVPAADASRIADLPPVGVLFAAFLGYNPIQELLGSTVGTLPPDQAAILTGHSFFPQLISGPFADGLSAAFWFAVIACVVAAVGSWFAGGKQEPTGEHESVGGELAAVAGGAGAGPSELVTDDAVPDRRPAGLAHAAASNGAAQPASHRTVDERRHAEPGELIGRLSAGSGAAGVDGVVTVTDRDGRQIARTSASGGEYSLRGLPPGTYTAVASAPGFRPAVTAVTLNGVGVVRDFALDGNGLVTGTVTAADGGAPVPGALVIATDARGQVVGRVYAGPDGTFQMVGMPSGSTTVAASATDHEPSAVTLAVEPGTTSVAELVLSSTSGMLSGMVTGPDGTGLSGATVTAVSLQGEVVGTVVADGAGEYAFLGMPAGEYTIVASTFAPVTTSVEVPAGEATRVDLQMGRSEDPASR